MANVLNMSQIKLNYIAQEILCPVVAAEGYGGQQGEGEHEAHEAVEELVETREIIDGAEEGHQEGGHYGRIKVSIMWLF